VFNLALLFCSLAFFEENSVEIEKIKEEQKQKFYINKIGDLNYYLYLCISKIAHKDILFNICYPKKLLKKQSCILGSHSQFS